MDLLVWMLALVFVFAGIVLAIRHRMLWGIGCILAGMLLGAGGVSLVS